MALILLDTGAINYKFISNVVTVCYVVIAARYSRD